VLNAVRHRIEGCDSAPQSLFPATACFDTDFVLLSMLDLSTLVPLCAKAPDSALTSPGAQRTTAAKGVEE
jgi:hypothetical protein